MIRILLVLAYSLSVLGLNTKTWIGKSNVSHVQFWNSVVSYNDMIFNASMNRPLAVPKTTEIEEDSCELIYPLDLGEGNYDPQSSSIYNLCLDKDLVEEMKQIDWLDPRNWKMYDRSIAIPHVEIIPCYNDIVSISNTSDTVIILPPNTITLRMIRIGYKTYVASEMRSLSQNQWFANHFVVKSSNNLTAMFNLSSAECRDRTGCMCGNSQYTDKICSFVEKNCTQYLPCQYPIKPIGHCCPVCASTVVAVIDQDRFMYTKFKTLVVKHLEEESRKLSWELVWHISKTGSTWIQIILMSAEGYNEELVDLADTLEKLLEKSNNLAIRYCITEHSTRSSNRNLATFFTVIIILTGILLGGALVVYLSKFKFLWSSFPQNFSLAKFKNAKNDVKSERLTEDRNPSPQSDRNESPRETESVSKSDSGEGFSLIDTFG